MPKPEPTTTPAVNPASVTEPPAPGAVVETAVQTQAPETPPTAPSQPIEPDYDTLLSREDVLDRLLQHPKAQQKLKTVREADVQRRAEEIANRKLAAAENDRLERERVAEDQRRERRQAELSRLREEDPSLYIEETRREDARVAAARQEDMLQQRLAKAHEAAVLATYKSFDDSILNSLFFELPAEAQASLAGKRYDGMSPVESRLAYLKDIIHQHASNGSVKADWEKAAKAEWEKDVARRVKEAHEAGYKEALATAAGGRPSPDLGSGQPVNGALHDAEWQEHKYDKAWMRANKDRINEAIAENRLQP